MMKWNGDTGPTRSRSRSRISLAVVIALAAVAIAVFLILKPQQEPSVTTAFITASVKPSTIHRGEVVVLRWQSDNVKELYLTSGTDVRKLDSNGETLVSPTESTVFMFTGSDPSGRALRKEITLIVVQPLPSLLFTVEPTVVRKGGTATLQWTSTDATSVNITEVGDVPVSGTTVVAVKETTEYTITAIGLGGAVTQTVRLTILDSPSMFLVDPKFYHTAELYTVMGIGGKSFQVVGVQVPKGTKVRSPWSGEFYHGWGSIMGQSTLGVTVEYPSVINFQRGVSVDAVGLVFKKQDRMVAKGEIIATTDRDGKIFINFYMNLGDNIASRDEAMFRLHFPQLFNGTK
ncbi:MAG: hypothetical protein DDT42_02072 [candidate division WS2 bacterium]|uniref:Uncharacterized protein n=1 Tax=Psychracetigena formicireducens TaxID=2986056 RepID=A0A9E2F7A3_PSYF1|nr:hypothetical protein [Candidatus Psychracetigena formicireducens]